MFGKTNTVRSKYLGLGAASLGCLALLPTSLSAAPIGGVNELRAPSVVVQADYQCWWADGDRHCAWLNVPAGPRVYGYDRPYDDYYTPRYDYSRPYYRYRALKRPEAYWPGSARWWKSMEARGRAGNGQD
jgi:hypothetical protein